MEPPVKIAASTEPKPAAASHANEGKPRSEAICRVCRSQDPSIRGNRSSRIGECPNIAARRPPMTSLNVTV